MLKYIIRFFLENRTVALLLLGLFFFWGVSVAPFNWELGRLPRNPVPVDAIPDLGENQQIVFTSWMGRSPQDVEDQITYPLTSSLLGVPGVKTIRSSSMFGFSSVYVIFEEEIDFYWSRSRILEKLNSLPSGTLPDGVNPTLGPDATALGQVFWYTLEGRDSVGNVTGGWDLHELRTIQDYNVRYALASVSGVSEVASIGGHVKEYQVDVDPVAMKAHSISLGEVMIAVKNSNIDVGAKTIEINRAEYLVRGLGYLKSIEDLEASVVAVRENVPIRIRDIAHTTLGPAPRRGALDNGGAEAVGGVIVARYGANPLEVIENVKAKISQIDGTLPQKILEDGSNSQVTIVPFYDRSGLINETLGTLEEALTLEILITIIVVILMVLNLRASILIGGLLPVSVLMCFIAMKYFGVDANIVALSGIAIAIGTMVDMGVVLSENMLRHLEDAKPEDNKLEIIYKATTEVASAVLTAVATTIVSFIPVFTMVAAEGKLFKPLAFTKTFALAASILVTITLLPPLAHWLFSLKPPRKVIPISINILAAVAGLIFLFISPWFGILLIGAGLGGLFGLGVISLGPLSGKVMQSVIYALAVAFLLNRAWLPLGPEKSELSNYLFVVLVIGLLIVLFYTIMRYYERLLRWCLRHKTLFLLFPSIILLWGIVSWVGFKGMTGIDGDQGNRVVQNLDRIFPGIGSEFMPSLDEGSFLLMPTSMPHSGIEENLEVVSMLDMAVNAIPEVETVVGKLGRVESALDPAPISMFENVINYKPEFITDSKGRRLRFLVNDEGEYARDSLGNLVQDENGSYYRNWRDHIKSPDDIWQEISNVSLPGVTAAPKLQPIETRLVMLQTGMRAPMGIKVKGPDLKTIEAFGYELERIIKEVPGVKTQAVFADRIVGKPYLEIALDRDALARYGLSIATVQNHLEMAVGGMNSTKTVEGRERYDVRIRYARELRESPEAISQILIPVTGNTQIPLGELASINYVRGPQVIKSEDTFLQGYVLFDKLEGEAEVELVERCKAEIDKRIENKDLLLPEGISYEFAGSYENQQRATDRLSLVIPLALVIIFLILYFQFRSAITSLMIFSSIAVAFGGGFIMIWLYGQSWFLDVHLFGTHLRELFQVSPLNLSVAVWVGFIALFGIATDDGVVMTTYLKQTFEKEAPASVYEVREAVIRAGKRRIRPCLMTTATTLLALLPILSSTGRGSDIMIPMAIPSFGGMAVEVVTLFVIPVLYAMWQERRLTKTFAK